MLFENAFRVGIGSLCGRASPTFLLEVITRIQAIIGIDVPLHVWGAKLKVLQSGIAFPGVISCDSGAWNGLFGREHEKRRASSLTVVEYSWQIKHPIYMQKVARVQQRPQQLGLGFADEEHKESFPNPIQLVAQLNPMVLMEMMSDRGIDFLVWLSFVREGSIQTITAVEM